MNRRSTRSDAMSRRRFVALVAAGSAALIAKPAEGVAAAAAKRRGRGHAAASPAMPAATAKELARQRASTLETLKTIRGHAMPPGTELGFVFRATPPRKRSH